MIGRVIRFEVTGLRRTGAVPLTILFAVGGGMLGRSITWLASLMATYEQLPRLLRIDPIAIEGAALPLMLLALIIAAAYVFGHDLADGTVDALLTAPISRDAIVVGKLALLLVWVLALAALNVGADASIRWALSLGTVDPGPPPSLLWSFGAALAAFAGLPVIAWMALRFRGVLAAVGAGIALLAVSMTLRGMEIGSSIPWNAPHSILAGAIGADSIVGPLIVLGIGVLACLREMRRLDLA